MRKRGFEVVKRLEDKKDDIILPKRSTKNSAGYDFFAYEDVIIPSILPDFLKFKRDLITGGQVLELGRIKPVIVKTGIKAYMQEDEVLYLFNRSSNPGKLGLVLVNGTGVIDADYYGNEDNDGEICFALYNIFPINIKINKGDKIGQGVFQHFLKIDNDKVDVERKGGFGSTGNN